MRTKGLMTPVPVGWTSVVEKIAPPRVAEELAWVRSSMAAGAEAAAARTAPAERASSVGLILWAAGVSILVSSFQLAERSCSSMEKCATRGRLPTNRKGVRIIRRTTRNTPPRRTREAAVALAGSGLGPWPGLGRVEPGVHLWPMTGGAGDRYHCPPCRPLPSTG